MMSAVVIQKSPLHKSCGKDHLISRCGIKIGFVMVIQKLITVCWMFIGVGKN